MTDEKVEVSKEVKEPEKSKEEKERYEITEIVTETGVAIKDNNTEKIFTQDGFQVEVLNKLDKIERAIFQK